MSDALREMMSAVVDGEASEFEQRKVLDALGSADDRARIARHYTVRSVLRSEAEVLCPQHLSLNIMAAIAAEPAVRARPGWVRPLGGVAVAASVCLATLFGVQTLNLAASGQPAAGAPALAAAANTLGNLGAPAQVQVSPAAGLVPVGFGPASPAGNDAGSSAADALARQRLQMFMDANAENAALNASQGMLPYARVVSFETP